MRIDMPDPGDARSYWLQEALAHDPGEPCPSLKGNFAADVCIVGGGFAGLWTALMIAEREPSLRIALLESDICGGGASGRNGGFASSSWWDLDGLTCLFGREGGLRYAQLVADQVHEIDDWVKANGVDCWYYNEGVLVGRAGRWQEAAHREDVEVARALGVEGRIYEVSAGEARAIADSPRWVGGVFVKDCAICQPARLARGMRRVALEKGVRVFENTRVSGIDSGIPAVVRAAGGAIRADQVVLTHGAWAAGWPGFGRSFANIVDYMVATEPIPDRIAEIGWDSQIGIGDSRVGLLYLRKTDDDRIAIGGGAMGVLFGGRIGKASTHDRRVAEAAARWLLWLFPQLEGVRFTHSWGGPIDQTTGSVPFFETRKPGNVHAGLGFSGHGLTQTRLGGKILASLVLGADDEWAQLSVVGPPLGKVPPEPLRYPLVKAMAWALESGDRNEEAGRGRGFLQNLLASGPDRVRSRIRSR